MTVPQADSPAEITRHGGRPTPGTALLGTGLLPPARAWGRSHWRIGAFSWLPTATLFGAAAAAERNRVRQQFYGLDHRLIERVYAGETTMKDKLRILTGRTLALISAARSGAST